MSDSQRQTYYDNHAQMLHTVVGGDGGWTGAGGVGPATGAGFSQLNVARNAYPGSSPTPNGAHTNWIFAGQDPNDVRFVAGGAAHEDGHAFGLYHQSLTGASPQEYDPGDPAGPTNGGSSVSAIMGGQNEVETRNTWRTGTKSDGSIQNDVASILSNPNMTLTEDGIGHSMQTATSLALNGSNVDPSLAQGYINSASGTDPQAIGVDNYTKDFYSFMTDGSAISLTLHAGSSFLTAGVADLYSVTFDGSFNILNANGVIVGSSLRDASTLFYTYDGTLAAGSYYMQILDFGGYTSSISPTAQYYTSGSYFITGSGGFIQSVPGPGPMATFVVGGLAMLRRRKRSA